LEFFSLALWKSAVRQDLVYVNELLALKNVSLQQLSFLFVAAGGSLKRKFLVLTHIGLHWFKVTNILYFYHLFLSPFAFFFPS
jgi:hypothetical protein